MFSVIAAASVIVHFVLGDKPGGPKTGRFFRRPAYYFSEIKTENHTMPIRCDFGSRGAFWGLKTPKSDSPFFMKRRKVTSVSGRVPIAIVSLADTHRPSPDTPWPLFSAPPAFPAPPPRRCSRPAGTRSPSSAPPAASASLRPTRRWCVRPRSPRRARRSRDRDAGRPEPRTARPTFVVSRRVRRAARARRRERAIAAFSSRVRAPARRRFPSWARDVDADG